MRNFSSIAQPLYSLTGDQGKKGKMKKKASYSRGSQNSQVSLVDKWSPQCEKAFKELKDNLCSDPVLTYADLTHPFTLTIDASRDGLGAVLYQEKDDRLHPVAYGSRGLSKSERNYPARKLEYLCLKWAVCDKFRDYLYHAKNTKVFTDNNPLTYIFSTAKLDATGQRWLADLSNYDFTLHYRSGRKNIDADGLSRRPYKNVAYNDEDEQRE